MEFPKGFETLLNQSLPQNEVNGLMDSFNLAANTSIRINTKNHIFIADEWLGEKIPHTTNGYVLKNRPSFVSDPAFHSGQYYVQEANSMVIGKVAEMLLEKITVQAVVLDLCAAPGGKSTHLASILRPEDILVANEVIHSRTPILHENLSKWGMANHLITRADSRQLGNCEGLFNLIVADMPCSGEGMFRKDPNAVQEWSESNVNICCDRQKRIAGDIWPSLAEGGYFIYSTCTYNIKENEENMDWIVRELGAEIVPFPFPIEWNFYENKPGMYRLMPHRTIGEGFFFCVLKKISSQNKHELKRIPKINETKSFDHLFQLPVTVFEWQKELFFIGNKDTNLISELIAKLPALYSPGTTLGRCFDKGLKPDTQLALSHLLKKDALPNISFNDDQILRFYRREAVSNPDKKEGMYLVVWNNIPMGLVNGVKHQWNNQWPMEWRIRKEGLQTETILGCDLISPSFARNTLYPIP